jgi:nitroreductase
VVLAADEIVTESTSVPVDARAVLAVIGTTRAIRRYRTDPIPDDDLTTMLWAATRGPNASNTQPVRLVVLRRGDDTSAAARRLLGNAFRAYWATKADTERWWEGSGAQANTRKGRAARAMQDYVDHFEDIPVVVLACQLPLRPIDPYYVGSVYPACQNLLLAARALGYGGTLASFHMHVERDLKALLGIPEDVFVASTITLGRPQGHHGPLRRKPVSEVVFDGRWGQPAAWIQEAEGADA